MQTIIDISNHPVLGLKRKVQWKTFIFSLEEEQVKLFTRCLHYNQDDTIFSSNAVKDFEKTLIASNQRNVNPTNGLVCNLNEDNEWEDMAGNLLEVEPVGQFTFFTYLIGNPVNIPPLIESIIQQEDVYFHGYD